jgi:hypothetical protein
MLSHQQLDISLSVSSGRMLTSVRSFSFSIDAPAGD